MRHAIEALARVDDQQQAEVEAMADLVSRAATFLREGAPMTAEGLSSKLGVDPETLVEALDAAVARGELLQQAHYRLEACGCRKLCRGRWPAAMGADAEYSCTESRTDSWSPDGARNPWSAPTTE